MPRFATWDEFRRLEAEGLTMFGQMTAGSWIYIGTQGILQGTYQTFAAAGETHWGSPDLAGRTVLTAGLGGMGGAQPLAASLAGAASLNVEVDPHRIERRLETRYLDEVADDLDDAIDRVRRYAADERGVSVGILGNAADVFAEIARRGDALRPGDRPDVGARHAERVRARGDGRSPRRSPCASPTPTSTCAGRARRPSGTCRRCSTCRRGQPCLRLRQQPAHRGPRRRPRARLRLPGIRPRVCQAALLPRRRARSGGRRSRATRPTSTASTRRSSRPSPTTCCSSDGCALAPERIAFQGLPARICWLGYGDRAKAGLLFNDLVRRGEVSAPIAIGRDHLDTGSVASPFRETEAMRDGSDAIADWPILNALLSTASGASWVSVHHGGGVGIGNSIHAGLVVVADGTDEMDERLTRVLTNDPGIGVARHADAGYPEAIDAARAGGIDLPMEG